MPPRATYRIQFTPDFGFDAAAAIAPYLAKLGVSHLYASPYCKSRPGSTHGYDIVDHGAINPELGGEAGFVRLSDALRAHGLKLLLDIVPNHMGVGGADNPWWLSVLEWGALSPFGHAFDIDWERLGANRNLVIPFLGERYGEALENGNLELKFDAVAGAFSVWHYEHQFPIRPLNYPTILNRVLAALGEAGLEPDTFIAEYGKDQFEVTVGPARGVAVADQAVALREIVREAARLAGREGAAVGVALPAAGSVASSTARPGIVAMRSRRVVACGMTGAPALLVECDGCGSAAGMAAGRRGSEARRFSRAAALAVRCPATLARRPPDQGARARG